MNWENKHYMKNTYNIQPVRNGIFILFCIFTISACDRNSSPEGRMSMKIESLQKNMIDSLQNQNRAILDSLSQIRKQLNEIKQLRK